MAAVRPLSANGQCGLCSEYPPRDSPSTHSGPSDTLLKSVCLHILHTSFRLPSVIPDQVLFSTESSRVRPTHLILFINRAQRGEAIHVMLHSQPRSRPHHDLLGATERPRPLLYTVLDSLNTSTVISLLFSAFTSGYYIFFITFLPP